MKYRDRRPVVKADDGSHEPGAWEAGQQFVENFGRGLDWELSRLEALGPAVTSNRGRARRSEVADPVGLQTSLRSCEVLVGLAAYAHLPDLPTAAHQARRL